MDDTHTPTAAAAAVAGARVLGGNDEEMVAVEGRTAVVEIAPLGGAVVVDGVVAVVVGCVGYGENDPPLEDEEVDEGRQEGTGERRLEDMT